MNNTLLISFIIPAYNAANILTAAVKSIIDTKCTEDYEIIIVENGSTDETVKIAQKLMLEDTAHVKFFQSMKGVSNARNMGLKKASGKWIAFVDADDYLKTDKLKFLCADALSGSADLYIYGYEAGDRKMSVSDCEDRICYSDHELEELKAKIIENPTRYMQVWGKLFRKDIILENKIFFNPAIRLAEDSDFTIRYLEYCKKILLNNMVVYHYSLENDSTMRTFDGTKAQDYEAALKITQEYVLTQNSNVQNAYHKYVLMHLNIILAREIFCVGNAQTYRQKIVAMKHLSRKKIFNDAINTIQLREAVKPRLLPIFLIKQKLYYFSSIIYIIRAHQNWHRENKNKGKL